MGRSVGTRSRGDAHEEMLRLLFLIAYLYPAPLLNLKCFCNT